VLLLRVLAKLTVMGIFCLEYRLNHLLHNDSNFFIGLTNEEIVCIVHSH